jgi:alpha-beta hydrolase superfamily lysophospholipase
MRWVSHYGLAAAAAFSLAAGFGFGQEKENSKRVVIPTVDGVELEGTYYPNPNGKKDACVLLLHNFDKKNGGDSHKDGWDHLAEALQAKGYAVLSFDFRGFGNSKKVNPAKFWSPMFPHNRGVKPADKSKESIDSKYFPPPYYANLVNDIAAAKAFLDRRNDARELNSSNLIVIGAGEGAALGALWMAAQCRLQKDRNPPALAVGGAPPALDEPESKDLACAIWLSISPTVGGQRLPIKNAVRDTVHLGKVRTALIFGKGDTPAVQLAKDYFDAVVGTKNDFKGMVAKKDVGTALSGSKLLNDTLDTEKWIIDDCLENVLERRSNMEWKRRETDKYAFFWAFPKPGPAARLIIDKLPNEELHRMIPLESLGINAP